MKTLWYLRGGALSGRVRRSGSAALGLERGLSRVPIRDTGLTVEEFHGTLEVRGASLRGAGLFVGLYSPEVGVPMKRGTAVEESHV